MFPTHWLWAKLGANTWPEAYHPLICHLVDVGMVAMALYDHCLSHQTKVWFIRNLNAQDEKSARGFLGFWCATHDLGKATPAFQLGTRAKTGDLGCHLEKQSYTSHIGKPWPHGLLTVTCLQEILSKEGAESLCNWDSESVRALSVAVGGHHGVLEHADPEDAILQAGNNAWIHSRRELIADLLSLYGSNGVVIPPPARIDSGLLMFLAGITSVADWIGSNAKFFTFWGNTDFLHAPFDVQAYAKVSGEIANKALKTLGWLRGRATEVSSPKTFREIFPRIVAPRPLQEMVERLSKDSEPPGLVIVEAPMGEGKTEAAWYLAESWQALGGQGIYVALPTMATSNQMFSRVLGFLENKPDGANLMLQHGKAAFNELFESIDFEGEMYGDDEKPSGVVAARWFSSNKLHGLLAPFGVGTIDQALVSVLQTRHFFVRMFGLAGKTVILDEVHAYDAYTSTLLERLIRWLSALNCRVVLLSATLPSKTRSRLIQAYLGKTGSSALGPVPYPRISWTRPGEQGFQQESFPSDESRNRRIRVDWLDEQEIPTRLEEALEQGGCAVVIRNTVGEAQATYRLLKDRLTNQGIDVMLFHARFPYGRRAEIEARVLACFGKGSNGQVPNPGRPHKAVLVATQVVEQSLDLDFD